jgi:hypothetical protein
MPIEKVTQTPMSASTELIDSDQLAHASSWDPIPFSSQAFSRHSRRYVRELGLVGSDGDIWFDARFNRKSAVEFLDLCQDRDIELTSDNVIELSEMAADWEIDEGLRSKIVDYMASTGDQVGQMISVLQFRLRFERSTCAEEELLRSHLSGVLNNSRFSELPIPVVGRIINFENYEDGSPIFGEVFRFCLRYIETNGPSASFVFKTLSIDRLNRVLLKLLIDQRKFEWRYLKGSACRTISCLLENVESFENRMNFLACEVQRLEQRIEEIQGHTEQNRALSVDTRAALEELVKSVEGNHEDISNVRLKMESTRVEGEDVNKKLQKELSVLKSDLETGRGRMGALEGEIQKATTVMNESMRRQASEVSNLVSREQSRSGQIDTLVREMGELRQRAITSLGLTARYRQYRREWQSMMDLTGSNIWGQVCCSASTPFDI